MPTADYGKPEWDLYPEDDDEYAKLSGWCQTSFDSADRFRKPHEDKWKKYFRLYNNWVESDPKDWRSRVFMPEVFQNIETIKPRLIAELPKFVVLPQGEEDVSTAELMEELIGYAVRESKLYIELYNVYHDMLLYGTGILKTFYGTIPAFRTMMEEIIETETLVMPEEVIDPETGQVLRDPDGNPVVNDKEVQLQVPTGQMRQKLETYDRYDGPMVEAVDPFNFWVEPQAKNIDDARYVIHRTFQPLSYVKRLRDEGKYRVPDGTEDSAFFTSSTMQPQMERLDSIDLGSGNDYNRTDVEILEYHINDGPGKPGRIVTVANRSIILRAELNVYFHSQKPFVIFYDYKQPHEFYGRGEVQAIEGLQDMINAISNQRIDNGRLGMDQGFVVNESQIKSSTDLIRRPGQVVRVTGDGMTASDVLWPIPTTEVTATSFNEVAALQQMIERTSGVSNAQRGDTPEPSETATGMAILQEAGNTRFALKSRLNELDGLTRLAFHYGSTLQQFITEEKVVRLIGPEGSPIFKSITPEALQGALDYSISSESIMQSETMRRQQKMDVFNLTLTAVGTGTLPPTAVLVAYMDVLESFGIKNPEKYLQMPQQQMLPMALEQTPMNGQGMPMQQQMPMQGQMPMQEPMMNGGMGER